MNFRTNRFEINFINIWKEYTDNKPENGQTIFEFISPDTNGVIQISVWDKKENSNPQEFLDSHLFWDYKRSTVNTETEIINGQQAAWAEFDTNNKRWKGHWILMAVNGNNYFAYLTYTCDLDYKDEKEFAEVLKIFKSIKVK